MAEGGEWVRSDSLRLMAENEELKHQLKLMKENQELRKLLLESYREAQPIADLLSLSNLSALSQYPAATLMGPALKTSEGSLLQRRSNKTQEKESQPSLEQLLSSSFPTKPRIPNTDGTQLTHATQPGTQRATVNRFFHSPELYQPRNTSEKKQTDVLNVKEPRSLVDQLPQEEERPKSKKVWFPDSFSTVNGSAAANKTQSYYSNDIKGSPNAEKNQRIVGEIAFQLDRRILAHVFPGTARLYGYTVLNIPEKIRQVCRNSLDGSIDEQKHGAMTKRYTSLMSHLEKLGYNCEVHPIFSEFLINTYGILKQRVDNRSNPAFSNPVELRTIVIDTVQAKFLRDTLVLLTCLCELSRSDSKPLFTW